MIKHPRLRAAGRWSAAIVGAAAAGYAGYIATAWLQYGNARAPRPEEVDSLLDRFMPRYEVVDRHQIAIAAPAGVVLTAAREMRLGRSPVIRAIFRAREFVLGATPQDRTEGQGLLAEMQSIGWRVLAEIPGREVSVLTLRRRLGRECDQRSAPHAQGAADGPKRVQPGTVSRCTFDPAPRDVE